MLESFKDNQNGSCDLHCIVLKSHILAQIEYEGISSERRKITKKKFKILRNAEEKSHERIIFIIFSDPPLLEEKVGFL